MTDQKPSIGRLVHYKLSSGDVSVIGSEGRFAADRSKRNPVREGDVYPALVVRVFDPSVTTANLQVFLDGDCSYWATSRQEGDELGQWSWPARV